MKVNKFKKVGKNKYKVIFDNTELTLFEDIILKYELLTRSDIDVDLIDKIIEENRWYEAYDMALSYIEIKMRNKREIIKYLEKKMYDEKIINNVIQKLNDLGLLNEKDYIRAFINDKVNLTSDGPYKIKNELLDLDFNENDINDYLYTIEDEIWKEKLIKIINKKKNLMIIR
ncbi:MAG: RecX family transcriptional regulator [Bacilli bacterium]|nr:RecX family transcriptional regulator [Bacilli bacterium]